MTSHKRSFKEMVRKYLHRALSLKTFENKVILDLGCGDTTLQKHLSNCFYIGADLNKEDLAKGWGNRVLCTSERLPFKDGVFHRVYMIEVLEHLIDPLGSLSEVKRVLDREGDLILSVPNELELINRIEEFLGFRGTSLVNDPLHVHKFTHRKLHELLVKSDLREVRFLKSRLIYVPRWVRSERIRWLIARLLGVFMPRDLTAFISVICERSG